VGRQLTAIPAARRSRGTETDFPARDAPLPDAPPPDSADLRRPWQTVPNQGHTASCVGWSVAESLRWYLVEAGRLKPDQPLSPRHVWMAAKETDQRTDYPSTFLEEDGTSLKAGLDVVRRFGAVLESELPWAGGLVAGSPDDFNRSAGSRKIVSYFTLGDDSVPDRSVHFDGWRRWLAHSGPVLVLLQVDKHLETATLDTYDEASADGSHAAALYGYGPDHFLLRSSWGPGWGDGGYARMSLAYAARAVIESYGVIV
jgi:Papain family cysteine protease